MKAEIVSTSSVILLIYIATSLGIIMNNFKKIQDKKRRPIFIMFAISVALLIACPIFSDRPGKLFSILFIILYAAQLILSVVILSMLKTRINKQEEIIFVLLIINLFSTSLFLYFGLKFQFYHFIFCNTETEMLSCFSEKLIPSSINPEDKKEQEDFFTKNCVFNLPTWLSNDKLLEIIEKSTVSPNIKNKLVSEMRQYSTRKASEFQNILCEIYYKLVLNERQIPSAYSEIKPRFVDPSQNKSGNSAFL